MGGRGNEGEGRRIGRMKKVVNGGRGKKVVEEEKGRKGRKGRKQIHITQPILSAYKIVPHFHARHCLSIAEFVESESIQTLTRQFDTCTSEINCRQFWGMAITKRWYPVALRNSYRMIYTNGSYTNVQLTVML